MRNISIKYCLLLTLFSICLKPFAQGNQPTNSVTITPTSTTTDVKGNIKASGLVEANGLKAAGLATGNPFVANPVYANLYGDLVTGYKTGFTSIPPVAFQQNFSAFGSEANIIPSYLIFYSEGTMIPFVLSQNLGFIAPLQLPHKSKLETMKLGFSFGGSTPKSIRIYIRKASMDGTSSVDIADIITPTSANNQFTIVNIPLNLVEIDNQNFYYSIVLFSNSNWEFFYLRGTSIEYRDM